MLTRFRLWLIDRLSATDFEKSVWQTLCNIRSGQVMSYQAVAKSIGRPLSQRAIGNALAKNPIPILIPCHRVVRKDGEIGNYSFWGQKKTKRLLLKTEYWLRSRIISFNK